MPERFSVDPESRDNPLDLPPLAERLLLVEDSEEDVFLFRRLLGGVNRGVALDIVADGETAVQWLSETLAESRGGRPVVPRAIFVDLKLPGMHGTDVVRWIRAQPRLNGTLVAICSASADERDIRQADALRANAYLRKYPRADQLAALLTARDPQSVPRELTGYAPA